jgi:hypothetical protein
MDDFEGSLRGVPFGIEPIWLDAKLPGAVRQYRHRISRLDEMVLTGLSLACAPSGAGELVISALGYGAGTVAFTAAGGQPMRCYTLLLSATRSDGMVSEYLLSLRITFVLPTDQAQAAPSAGFGTALTLTVP